MITIEQRVPGHHKFTAIWQTNRKVRVTLELVDADGDVDTREFIWAPPEDMSIREGIESLVNRIDEEPHWRANIIFNEIRIGTASKEHSGTSKVEWK